MTLHLVNTMASMFGERPKKEPEQLELKLNDPRAEPKPDEVIGLIIAGQGSDKPELTIHFHNVVVVKPLANPVTVKQIADILSQLG
jgi:hypothetical protein